jgi:phosphatidylinositol-3,4,5-trisphosphate 3-phosphatase/dual-specificity protein phosphatase PTEN
MGGRVSRYPFPDHNPPPLPLLPLAVREMTAWLEGDPERIAIIHCKAGKGRSGTLLVSYLLSLPELPPAPREGGPQLDDSKVEGVKDKLKENVKHRTHDAAPHDEEAEVEEADNPRDEEDALSEPAGGDTSEEDSAPPAPAPGAQLYRRDTHVEPVATPVPDQPKHSYTPIAIGDEEPLEAPGQWDRRDHKLDEIFLFHSGRRMKPSTTKARRGVSIASRELPPPGL